MKLGTFDIRAWTWRGQKLAPLRSIARRLPALPVLWIGKALVFLACWLGWGLDDATDAWERLP